MYPSLKSLPIQILEEQTCKTIEDATEDFQRLHLIGVGPCETCEMGTNTKKRASTHRETETSKKHTTSLHTSNHDESHDNIRLQELQRYKQWLEDWSCSPLTNLKVALSAMQRDIDSNMTTYPDDSGTFNREIGINRLLQGNHMVRYSHGLRPFFPNSTAGESSFKSLYLDETFESRKTELFSKEEMESWKPFRFVVSHSRSIPTAYSDGVSRHALFVMYCASEGKHYIFDSHGRNGAHAKRLLNLCSSDAQNAVAIADIDAVQNLVTNTPLWKSGQYLGKAMGWCSLFALTCVELTDTFRLSRADLTSVFQVSVVEASFVLIIVRQVAYRLYHRALGWYLHEANAPPADERGRLLLFRPKMDSLKVTNGNTTYQTTFEDDVITVGNITQRGHLSIQEMRALGGGGGGGGGSSGGGVEDGCDGSRRFDVRNAWSLYLLLRVVATKDGSENPIVMRMGLYFLSTEIDTIKAVVRRIATELIPGCELPPVEDWSIDKSEVYCYAPKPWVASRIRNIEWAVAQPKIDNDSYSKLLSPCTQSPQLSFKAPTLLYKPHTHSLYYEWTYYPVYLKRKLSTDSTLTKEGILKKLQKSLQQSPFPAPQTGQPRYQPLKNGEFLVALRLALTKQNAVALMYSTSNAINEKSPADTIKPMMITTRIVKQEVSETLDADKTKADLVDQVGLKVRTLLQRELHPTVLMMLPPCKRELLGMSEPKQEIFLKLRMHMLRVVEHNDGCYTSRTYFKVRLPNLESAMSTVEALPSPTGTEDILNLNLTSKDHNASNYTSRLELLVERVESMARRILGGLAVL